MGIAGSPDFFHAKVMELMESLEYVGVCIDDLLCISRNSLKDHLEKLDEVLRKKPEKNVFRGGRGPWPPHCGPRLISTDLKRGRGFLAPPNIWSWKDLSPIRNICSVLRRFAAFCSVLRRFAANWRQP